MATEPNHNVRPVIALADYPQPDSELVAAASELARAWDIQLQLSACLDANETEENSAAWEAAAEETNTLLERVAALPFRTLAGARARMLAFNICGYGPGDGILADVGMTTDVRLLRQIVEALLPGGTLAG